MARVVTACATGVMVAFKIIDGVIVRRKEKKLGTLMCVFEVAVTQEAIVKLSVEELETTSVEEACEDCSVRTGLECVLKRPVKECQCGCEGEAREGSKKKARKMSIRSEKGSGESSCEVGSSSE
eukprot:symbB.v1.2.039314.t1/scaffold6480.1/size17753/1